MPYIKKTIKAGQTIEIQKYYSSRYKRKDIERGKRTKPTPLEMEKINEKRAADRLRQLINANFGEKDIHLVLTYKRENRTDPEQAKKDLEKFLRKARAHYKVNNNVLKYIAVTEYKNKAIHHHILVNCSDIRELLPLWEHGYIRPTYLDNRGDHSAIAEYFIKETCKTFRTANASHKKRWCASKNLIQPEIKTEIVSAESWRKEPKAPKGYQLIKGSLEEGLHEVTGYPYIKYRLIKIDDKRGKDYAKKKKCKKNK